MNEKNGLLRQADLRKTKPDRHTFQSLRRNPIHIVMDGLKHSSNIGNIFRLADALLAEKVWVCGSGISLVGSRFIRASKGISKWVPHESAHRAEDAIRALKESGVFVIGVELARESVELSKGILRFPVAIVIGHEADGITPRALSMCDLTVKLPMLGMGNSINASNAASVVGYWALSEFERSSVAERGEMESGYEDDQVRQR